MWNMVFKEVNHLTFRLLVYINIRIWDWNIQFWSVLSRGQSVPQNCADAARSCCQPRVMMLRRAVNKGKSRMEEPDIADVIPSITYLPIQTEQAKPWIKHLIILKTNVEAPFIVVAYFDLLFPCERAASPSQFWVPIDANENRDVAWDSH